MIPKRVTGWHVLFATLAFFGVVIGVNATMMTYAIGTFGGVEEPDAYQKGLNYNETLARRSAEKAGAYDVKVEVVRGAGTSAHVSVSILQRDRAETDVAVSAVLRHPSDSSRDRSATLALESGGRFAGTVDDVGPGAWDVVVSATRDGREIIETRNRTWLP